MINLGEFFKILERDKDFINFEIQDDEIKIVIKKCPERIGLYEYIILLINKERSK